MKISKEKAYMVPVIVGLILILIGLFLKVPGGALTTYRSLDGDSAGSYYVFDKKYSAIDEYVGGDAYNYIIGASLVAGKTAGMIAAKAITMVGGAICVCFGVTLMIQEKRSGVPVGERDSNAATVCNMEAAKCDEQSIADTAENKEQITADIPTVN